MLYGVVYIGSNLCLQVLLISTLDCVVICWRALWATAVYNYIVTWEGGFC